MSSQYRLKSLLMVCFLYIGTTTAQSSKTYDVTTASPVTSAGHNHGNPTTKLHDHDPVETTHHHNHGTTKHHHDDAATNHHHNPGATTKHHHHDMTTGHHHHHMSTDMSHGDHGDMSGGHSMAMYFYIGNEAYILFSNWYVSSTDAMVGSCFVVAICSMLYEGLKQCREYLKERTRRLENSVKTKGVGNMSMAEYATKSKKSRSAVGRIFSCNHFLQTVLHFVQVTISYGLMLVTMTFNLWLFMSVVLGLTLGYFLFASKRSFVDDANDHCH
ncbi:high affinity copper uptake protein 1-like [Glandiceps talaboti]